MRRRYEPWNAALDRRLGHAEHRVLCLLSGYCDEKGKCWPANSTIAAILGVKPRVVTNHISKLAELGWISREDRSGKASITTVHFDFVPPLVAGTDPRTSGTGVGTDPCTSGAWDPRTSGTGDLRTSGAGDPRTSGAPTHALQVRGTYAPEVRTELYQGTNPIKGGDAPAPARGPVREAEPQAQPPPDQIDDSGEKNGSDGSAREPMPEVLPDHWAAIARNEFQGVDGLNDRGEHKLTRCFRRFKNEHVGETKTPEKWQGRWRNWLDGDFDPVDRPTPAAGANGQASGSAGGGNRHDPPMTRRGKGKLEEFTSAGLDLCKQFMRDAGEGKEFAGYEDRLLGRQLVQIFQGEGQILGVKWGPGWTADEVFARLPDFDAHTKENSQKPAEAGIERQL